MTRVVDNTNLFLVETDGPKLISVTEATGRLGITRARIIQLINAGRLPAIKVGNSYVINECDLKLLENRKPGRPAKKK